MSRNPHKNPNPQGKGLVPLLADWQSTRPALIRSKAPAELLFDWFVSALVLSARFQFRPVPGQQYFLYLREGEWRLSLIGPEEWGDRACGDCLGACWLRDDMTWAIEADESLAATPALQQALATLAGSFAEELDSDDSLAAQLPGYRRELPYFQRMLATGLGSSLRQSVGNSETLSKPTRGLLAQLGEDFPRRLLPGASRG
jgi:hypothetical protein